MPFQLNVCLQSFSQNSTWRKSLNSFTPFSYIKLNYPALNEKPTNFLLFSGAGSIKRSFYRLKKDTTRRLHPKNWNPDRPSPGIHSLMKHSSDRIRRSVQLQPLNCHPDSCSKIWWLLFRCVYLPAFPEIAMELIPSPVGLLFFWAKIMENPYNVVFG